VKELAAKLGVTERTIYRELPDVSQALALCGLKLETTAGKGMKIIGDAAGEKLKALLNTDKNSGFDSGHRKAILLLNLLSDEGFIKTEALALSTKVSPQTVRNDLKEIKKDLLKEGLSFITQKSEGVKIEGTVLNRNLCLVKLLTQNIELDIFLNWILDGDNRSHPLLIILERQGYHESLKKSFDLLKNLLKAHDIQVSDESLRTMLCILAIFIANQDKQIEYGTCNTADFVRSEFNAAFIDGLSRAFSMEITEEEERYLSWMLEAVIGRPNKKMIEADDANITDDVLKLIAEIEDRLELRLEVDQKFIESLVLHLNRSLLRIKSGLPILNPLGKEIEQNYAELYSVVEESARVVFKDIHFSREEIGYLVLYVAMAVDKIARNSFKVLVVCSGGMGSSRMLAARLEQEIVEIKVGKLIAYADWAGENLEDYDMIISTIPLNQEVERHIMVSPLLIPEEVTLIKDLVRRHRIKMLAKISSGYNRGGKVKAPKPETILNEITAISLWGNKLVEETRVFTVQDFQTETDLIYVIESLLFSSNLIPLPELLLQYKDLTKGHFQIPDTKLGYLEYCIPELEQPMLITFKLDEDQTYKMGEKSLTDLRALIVLFYPKWEEVYHINFLHDITLMLIEDPDAIQVFEQGDELKIRALVAKRITKYLADKLI